MSRHRIAWRRDEGALQVQQRAHLKANMRKPSSKWVPAVLAEPHPDDGGHRGGSRIVAIWLNGMPADQLRNTPDVGLGTPPLRHRGGWQSTLLCE